MQFFFCVRIDAHLYFSINFNEWVNSKPLKIFCSKKAKEKLKQNPALLACDALLEQDIFMRTLLKVTGNILPWVQD